MDSLYIKLICLPESGPSPKVVVYCFAMHHGLLQNDAAII